MSKIREILHAYRDSFDVGRMLFGPDNEDRMIETARAAELELDQAEADAAFRASVTELCDHYGMKPKGNAVCFVADRLRRGEAPDRTLVNKLAQVAADFDIPENLTLADFLEERCRTADFYEERLAETQHRLAELEQHGDPWKALDNVKQTLSSKLDLYTSAAKQGVSDAEKRIIRTVADENSVNLRQMTYFRDELLSRGEAVALAIFTIVATTGVTAWIQGLFN